MLPKLTSHTPDELRILSEVAQYKGRIKIALNCLRNCPYSNKITGSDRLQGVQIRGKTEP